MYIRILALTVWQNILKTLEESIPSSTQIKFTPKSCMTCNVESTSAAFLPYADYNDYEIVSTYEDAGKSGKSIEGRLEFNRMMEDITRCTFTF
mgnify:CR=1 FL=1